MLVIYLATSALLMGLVAVTLFASLERFRTRSSGSAQDRNRADKGFDEIVVGRSVERMADALGLTVVDSEKDGRGRWWVLESGAPILGGRYVVVAAPDISHELVLELRERVRAESALKGIVVSGTSVSDSGPADLDEIAVERLDVKGLDEFVDRFSAASRPSSGPADPGESSDHGEGPDGTRK